MPGIIILLVGGIFLYEFTKTKTASAQPLSATQLALLKNQQAQATQAGTLASALTKLTSALSSKPAAGGTPKLSGGGSAGTGIATQTGFQSPSNQPFSTLDTSGNSTITKTGDLGPNDVIPGTGMTVSEAQAMGFTADDIVQMEDQGITDMAQTNGVIGSVPVESTGLDNSLLGLTGAGVPQLDTTDVATEQDAALNQDVGIVDSSPDFVDEGF